MAKYSKIKLCPDTKIGCGRFKSIDCFGKKSSNKDGLQTYCKDCRSVSEKEYNKKSFVRRKKYRQDNCNKICVYRKKYYNQNKEYFSSRRIDYYNGHRDQELKSNKEWVENNKEKRRKQQREWAKNNRDKIKASRERNKGSIANKRKNDVYWRIRDNLRSRVYQAIKRGSKAGSAVDDLGCSIDEFKKYIERRFYPHPITGKQMTWGNWGRDGWHVDHIKPLSLFDLTDREQFKEACHYTNLQPLWAKENLSKGAKYEEV